ncbi:MAG: hypothetical protein E7568_01315 [Ruminococcaceae bacterium]|nr:hypothetical protein [Oscillospiraceae bacterium]
MIEIIILLVFLFFAVIGASSITYRVWMFMIKPKSKGKSIIITKLEKGQEKEQFIYCFEKYRWCGSDYADVLVMVCDENADKICPSFRKAYKNLICCEKEAVPDIINSELEV